MCIRVHLRQWAVWFHHTHTRTRNTENVDVIIKFVSQILVWLPVRFLHAGRECGDTARPSTVPYHCVHSRLS